MLPDTEGDCSVTLVTDQTEIQSYVPAKQHRQLSTATKHGRPQAWARGDTCPLPWKCWKVFLLQILPKTSAYKVFTHQFEKISSASGGLVPCPHQAAAHGPCSGISVLQTPSLPTPEGAHDVKLYETSAHLDEIRQRRTVAVQIRTKSERRCRSSSWRHGDYKNDNRLMNDDCNTYTSQANDSEIHISQSQSQQLQHEQCTANTRLYSASIYIYNARLKKN